MANWEVVTTIYDGHGIVRLKTPLVASKKRVALDRIISPDRVDRTNDRVPRMRSTKCAFSCETLRGIADDILQIQKESFLAPRHPVSAAQGLAPRLECRRLLGPWSPRRGGDATRVEATAQHRVGASLEATQAKLAAAAPHCESHTSARSLWRSVIRHQTDCNGYFSKRTRPLSMTRTRARHFPCS